LRDREAVKLFIPISFTVSRFAFAKGEATSFPIAVIPAGVLLTG